MPKAKENDVLKTKGQKIIQPVVVRTDNVAKELIRISSAHKVPVNSLDFTLLNIQTFTKSGANESEDWYELSADELKDLENDSQLLIPAFQIRQTYEIEVFTLEETPPLSTINVSIGANSTMTKVYLTIKAGSKLEYYDGFSNDFVHLINKKKLRAHLMIGLFDSVMGDMVSSMRAKLQVNDRMNFEKKEILQIAQGIDPVETISDDLILHYENREDDIENELQRVDYSKRGYLLSAVEDELLIEYIKPKLGSPGRNCRGEFLEPLEPIISHEPTFSVSDKIAVVDSEENILYRSKENGYVTFENATYDIKTEVDIGEISFKTTGSIETDLDAEVSINVKEKDVLKDAIGMGMEVEVNEIHVDGNVGPNARIRSMNAKVEGQTHKSSYMESDVLNINIHKGKAKGREIHITRLEHGEVIGDSVTIAQALGGKVTAREIKIETLGSHVKLTASQSISINKLQGGENTLIIDPLSSSKLQDDASEEMLKLDETKESLKSLEAEIKRNLDLIKKNEATFLDIKKRLIHYKKNGVKMPAAFVKKYKQFKF
ncbi:MAG: flagellar assembly protein A, partial [Campylobacterota bacterium]|nr:flagellar assembly protein A [Campylobacterota bacterium]